MYTTRKAYGPHGYRKPQTKAHDIARSILEHRARGTLKTLADYGITDGTMVALIEAALACRLAPWEPLWPTDTTSADDIDWTHSAVY